MSHRGHWHSQPVISCNLCAFKEPVFHINARAGCMSDSHVFCHVTCTEFFPKEFTSITCCRCILGIFLTMEGLGDFHCTIWNWFVDQLFWPLVFAPGCSSFATELQDGSYVSGGKFFKLAPYQPCALSSASILTLALFAVLNSVKVVLVRSE